MQRRLRCVRSAKFDSILKKLRTNSHRSFLTSRLPIAVNRLYFETFVHVDK